MRKELLIIVFIISSVFNTIQAESGNFKETHDAKDLVKIEIDIGSLVLTSDSSDAIGVECEFDLSGNTSYEPSVTVKNDYLKVEGEVKGSRDNQFRAKANWIISVPPNTKVSFGTSSGGVTIKDFKGDFVGNTGVGGIKISSCSGKFNLNTASGHIYVDDVILDDKSEFSTRSGDVMVRLSETPDFDISISTTSGSAILDFNGNKVRGYFEMSSIKGRDNIVCPFDFDDEWYVRMGGPGTSQKVIKAFTKESDTPFIEISGFPGGAILRN